jgi:hypothetical protein
MIEEKILAFSGALTAGVGQHSEMSIPGRDALPDAPPNWPKRLCPGSLNVLITAYPEGFTEPANMSGGVYQLDDGRFTPAFTIPGDLITENKLLHNGRPAAAQVWRARLHATGRADALACWVLRRLGSNVGRGKGGNVLELVSAEHLRTKYELRDGQDVVLEVLEGLQPHAHHLEGGIIK